jgi:hypothetical protein
MAKGRYADYFISQPKLQTELAHHNFTDISGFTFPDEVYLDGELEWWLGGGKDAEPAGIPLIATALLKVLRRKDGT